MVMPFVSMGSQNPGQRELPFAYIAVMEDPKGYSDRCQSLHFYTQGMRRLGDC